MRYFDPFRELDTLRREVDRLFNDFSGTGGRRGTLPWQNASRIHPLINITESGDHINVEALAPGADPKTLDIQITGKEMTISGEKTVLAEAPSDRYHRNERGSGRFLRSFDLPCEVDSANVNAEYKNGILTVKMAKAEAAKPKRIAVNVA